MSVDNEFQLLRDVDALDPLGLSDRVPLRFSPLMAGYVGPRPVPTIAALSGRSDPLRNWHGLRYGLGQLRRALPWYLKWVESVPVGSFRVPNDSVIYLKANGQVMVLISRAHGRAWKFDRSKHAETSQTKVAESWRAFEAAGMQAFMPAVISTGKLDPNTFIVESELACNRGPFFRTRHGKNWPRTFSERVLPILQRFHDRNGYQILDGPAWAVHLASSFAGRCLPVSMQAGLERDLDRIASLRVPLMPLCMISADLQPQNVHIDGKRCRILDWSNIKPAALITDVLCDVFYRAMATPEATESKKFWQVLADPTASADPASSFGRLCEIWTRWMEEWLRLKISPEVLHFQLRLMCWDWLATMDHPWRDDGSLINAIRFPASFLD